MKNTKTHLRRIVGDVKLTCTFEEFTTVLAQVEDCLNSWPLVSMNSPDDDGIKVLTPSHFLISQPTCVFVLYLTPHSPIVLCHYCAAGTSVKTLFATQQVQQVVLPITEFGSGRCCCAKGRWTHSHEVAFCSSNAHASGQRWACSSCHSEDGQGLV